MAVSVGFAPIEAKLSEQVWWIGAERLFSDAQLQSENTQSLKAEYSASFGGLGKPPTCVPLLCAVENVFVGCAGFYLS